MKARVVILCGGIGTRLREETEFRPKRPVMGLRQSHVISLGDRGILAPFSSSWAASSSRTYPVELFWTICFRRAPRTGWWGGRLSALTIVLAVFRATESPAA